MSNLFENFLQYNFKWKKKNIKKNLSLTNIYRLEKKITRLSTSIISAVKVSNELLLQSNPFSNNFVIL